MAIPKLLEKMRNSVQTSGGTMTGDLILSADPNQNLEAATKQYVDNAGGGFQAIYDETTWTEINNAYQSGKIVYCIQNDAIYYLNDNLTSGEVDVFGFLNSEHGMLTITSNNIWGQDNFSIAKVGRPNYFTDHQIMNGASTLLLGQARNITISTAAPTASNGNVGDVWIQYSE